MEFANTATEIVQVPITNYYSLLCNGAAGTIDKIGLQYSAIDRAKIIGINDVVKILKISEKTILKWRNLGIIPYTKVANRVYFNKDQIINLRNQLKEKEMEENFKKIAQAAADNGLITYRCPSRIEAKRLKAFFNQQEYLSNYSIRFIDSNHPKAIITYIPPEEPEEPEEPENDSNNYGEGNNE